ncbi:putative acyl-CoA dehydrogenase [Janibacter sp. HTCC2649]|uniref:acyl-CoA dehydrogenase family protein n=1 Tax=Janibacter sp. HTCC2649 TaxID=313589 RepID=UPI0000670CDA|nr:acyl-CoA dehydrogenase family protein [Janibacter sp. HTCC2649]EAQ00608.1 putative acyl-CoA dehydrogenase [Janibacter sp. HTCC2649]
MIEQSQQFASADMAVFAREARAFLDAAASRRAPETEVIWGVGEDRITYFGDDTVEEARRQVDAARAWQKARYDAGFGWITGPSEFGGRGLTPVHDLVYDGLEAEYDTPDTGVLSLIGLGMIGPTILAHGTQEAKARYLPAMYAGDVIACQLFSEPSAGSDLANVSTRAVRDGDEWVINGQKVWTSVAQHSQLGLALCRTNPDQPKHKGITALLVDMDSPGVDVRPLRQMSGGSEFNEVFLTDVRVPDSQRLGEIDGGWRVALTTLMNERASVGSEGAGPAGRAISLPFLSALLRERDRLEDPAARRRLAELVADQLATSYLNRQALDHLIAGGQPGPEASVSKLMYSQNLTRATHFATEIVGPQLLADTGAWGTFSWNELLLSTPALRILGGTEDIMKNILGERVLGLPKEPSIDATTTYRELRTSGAGS